MNRAIGVVKVVSQSQQRRQPVESRFTFSRTITIFEVICSGFQTRSRTRISHGNSIPSISLVPYRESDNGRVQSETNQ